MTSEPSSASFKPADFSPSQAGALALNAVFFDSPRRAADYHALFGSLSDLQDAWGLVESQLPDRLRPVAAARWKAFSLVDLKQKLSQSDIEPVFKTDSDYPSGLAELADAPPVVYIRGDRSVLGREGIAIVGSREMTEYGRQVTHQFTLDLAPYFTIISGLAKGVDGVAHRAAIQAGGTTIAVFGTGLDRVFPAEHRDLAAQILSHGVVLSEFPPGTPGIAHHFPQRNRIISALSRGVVVIEAKRKSGALVTAGEAVSQNREVFAVPGSVFSPLSEGPNQLIRQGARCVTSAEDIIQEFEFLPFSKLPTPMRAELPRAFTPPGLTEDEDRVWKLLEAERTLDELTDTSGLPVHRILPIVTVFEMKQWIEVLPGQRYKRKE